MLNFKVSSKALEKQVENYEKYNEYSEKHKGRGRLLALPVAILDVALDTFKVPIEAVYQIALAIINLIGSMFSKQHSLKDALGCTEFALKFALTTPVLVLMAPFKIFFQTIVNLIDPERALPMAFGLPAHKPKPEQMRFSNFN